METWLKKNEGVRLVLPLDLNLESLQEEWSVEAHKQESKTLAFWDTFEWGLWFGGYVLYRYGDVYHLCSREEGWLGALICEEESEGNRKFWGDFETVSMLTMLERMLGLRSLAIIIEGTFQYRLAELRNDVGKIVCRLELSSVTSGKQGEDDLLRTCHVLPLRGYETEAAHVVEHLTLRGAKTSGDGPIDVLLQHANREPQRYTLKPSFGLTKETPAREAIGKVVRTMLEIAVRNVPGIVSDLDTEFLHDYRICLRKIRSVLSLVKDVYPSEGAQRMRKILGDLARQTNRLRDLDVYLLAQDEYLGLLPPELRPALKEMFEDFSEERKIEIQNVALKICAHSWRKLFRKMVVYFSEETLHKPSPSADIPVGPLVFRCIYKRYRKIRVIAAGIGTETPDEVVHQLRIECKKLRYLMEFFSELVPKEEGALMQKMLKRLQGRLGDFNDASVQQKSLLNYWKHKKSGTDVAMGVGGLVSILFHRQQQTRGLIKQSLGEFCSGSTATAFKNTFKFRASVSATNAQ